MDAFELNKFAGAALFALLILFGTKTATNIIFKAHHPEKPGFEVEIAETSSGEAEKEEAAVPLAKLLAEASAEKGASIAKKCSACHTFDKGGANKIGPNLHGILGRPLGSVDGFAYSAALKEKGGNWDYESINHFVTKPKEFIPGTKMAFPGIKKGDQRADLILYLREQGDDKPPLPAAPAAEASPAAPAKDAEPAAPATEAAPAAPAADAAPAAPPADAAPAAPAADAEPKKAQ